MGGELFGQGQDKKGHFAIGPDPDPMIRVGLRPVLTVHVKRKHKNIFLRFGETRLYPPLQLHKYVNSLLFYILI
jgi:hypothetical protein